MSDQSESRGKKPKIHKKRKKTQKRKKKSKSRKTHKRNSKKKRRNKKFTQNRKKMTGGADEGSGTDNIRNPLMKIKACIGPNLNSDNAGTIASNLRATAIRAFNQLSIKDERICSQLEELFDNHSMTHFGNCWAGGHLSPEDKREGFLGGVSSGICRP